MNHIKKWHTAFADLTDFHGFRNDFIWNLCVLLLVTLISDVSAQEVTDKELYTILIQQVNIYSEIESFDEEKIILLNHAVSYADSGDHEVAVIYLEELLDQLQFLNNKTDILKAEEYPFEYDVMPISKRVKKSSRFRLSAITGIDYNRQEFEIDYFENDSAILEQISRPYIGIFAGFIYQFNPVYSLEITNSLRYDNDYLRNDYRIIWRAGTGIALQYNGYWNQSESVLASSFWEHEIDARFYSRINPTFALSIQNNFRHKTWSGISSYISDYNRNRFFAVADWQRFRLEYINELNESLGTEDLDYLQHSIRFGLRNQPGWQLTYDLEMDFTLRNYTLAFEDSILNNLYHQAGINLYFTLPLTGLVKLVSEDNFIYKSYNDKNSLEPDYLWNFFRPGLVINVARALILPWAMNGNFERTFLCQMIFLT